jgi:hypothetical protein
MDTAKEVLFAKKATFMNETSPAFELYRLAMARRATIELQAEDWALKTWTTVEARCIATASRDGGTKIKIEHEILPNRNAGRAEATVYLTALAKVLAERSFRMEVQGERFLCLAVFFGHFAEAAAP